MGGEGNLLTGGRTGHKNKRTLEGEDYAKDILVQDDEDILVTTVQDEVTLKDGSVSVVSNDVEMDRHPKAVADPVYRALRRQARQGVGNVPGQLPPTVFASLADRAFGKVVDRIKLNSGGRPLASESDEQLRERLREKLTMLDELKEQEG